MSPAVAPVPKPPMARVRSFQRPRHYNAKITQADCNFIADCAAKRITESEACRMIGLTPERWQVYKNRHKDVLLPMFEAVKASQLVGHLNVIEKAQSKDWRAADRLLSIKSPERYGKNEANLPATLAAADTLLANALLKVYGGQGVTEVSVAPLETTSPTTFPTIDLPPSDTKVLPESSST